MGAVGVLLGLVVAAAYGTADFLGGIGSRRVAVPAVLVAGQLTGLVLMVSLVLATGHDAGGRDVALGAGAGVAGFVGLALLFRGLARGQMAVVAPVTAVGSALTPFVWGLAEGERPSAVALAGVAFAVAGVAVVARPPAGTIRQPARRLELALAVIAGLAFGATFVLLDAVSGDAGAVPVVASRAVTLPLAAVWLALTVRRGWRPPPGTFATGSLVLLAAQGAFDSSANAVFLAATDRGLLSEVAVTSSLYPVVTVALAALFLHERVTTAQRAGLVLAIAGVVLLAV
jgi:uncharacterized membrane protein